MTTQSESTTMQQIPKTLLNITINDIEINLNEELYMILKNIGYIMKPTDELDLWSHVTHDNHDIKSNVGKTFPQILRKITIFLYGKSILLFYQEDISIFITNLMILTIRTSIT